MPGLPKLRVKTFPGGSSEEIYDFDKGKDLPFLDVLIFVEGQRVNSYEELIKLATQGDYQNRESLEVTVISAGFVDGG
jgi:hypothetical protein